MHARTYILYIYITFVNRRFGLMTSAYVIIMNYVAKINT